MNVFHQQLEYLLQENDFIAASANLVAFCYHEFKNINWLGFYFVKNNNLVLGPFQGRIACTHISFDKGICGRCYRTKKLINIPDVLAEQDHIACDSASRSELCIPILMNDKCYAILDIDSPYLHNFQKDDEEKAQIIAELYTNACKKHHWF